MKFCIFRLYASLFQLTYILILYHLSNFILNGENIFPKHRILYEKLHLVFAIAYLFIYNCSVDTNKEFNKAKQINTVKEYEEFLKKYPDSPQALNAKLQIEKLTSVKPGTSVYTWSSENSYSVIKDGDRFKDTSGQLKNIFKFHTENSKREFFTSVDGVKLAYDYFNVEGAKQALVISHGTGESSIRYAEVAYDLLKK